MRANLQKIRVYSLAGLFALVMGLFVLRMMQMQIVDGQMYEEQIQKGTQRTQTIQAARGEIVDRYGRPLAINRVSFDLVLDRAFLPEGEENDCILRVVELLEEEGEEWIDNLPISQSEPYTFLEGRESDVARLKKFVGVNDYADAASVMHWLEDTFDLVTRTQRVDGEKVEVPTGYTQQQIRTLAGIRYEMVQRGFNYSTPYVLARDLAPATATRVKERGFELPGADIEQSAVREYPDGDVATHILGLTGPIYAEELERLGDSYALNDTIGKSGIEKVMESTLRGTAGERVISINAEGDVVEVYESKAPVPGNTVMLTIDKNLQRAAQDALKKEIEYLNATAPEGRGKEAFAGAAVAVDVKSGEVLALVSYPSYDLNTYQQDYNTLAADRVNSPLLNRALQGSYTPGSIFKPAVALAGLNEGIVDHDSTVYCGGTYTHFDDYQPGCLGVHQNIDVVRALQVSCNIYFYDVGRRVGIDAINRYATAMGLGQPTGIELPEDTGHLSSPAFSASYGEDWVPGNVIQSAIGQKDNKFTPIQLASYAATLANRGTRMQTSIIRGVKSYTMEETVSSHQPTVASTLETKDGVFDTIFEGMVACARIGSAANYIGSGPGNFGSYPITVAAKTGTPETSEFPNSTFITFAPAEEPEIAIAVVIEKGWHGYTGAPVARAIYDAYFQSQYHAQEPDPSGVLLP